MLRDLGRRVRHVLARVLAHPINSEMEVQSGILRKVNGAEIKSLPDLAAAIAAAREKKGQFIVFEYESGRLEALDLTEAEAANAAILKNYGITRDRRL